jgi:hypothetical protein
MKNFITDFLIASLASLALFCFCYIGFQMFLSMFSIVKDTFEMVYVVRWVFVGFGLLYGVLEYDSTSGKSSK